MFAHNPFLQLQLCCLDKTQFDFTFFKIKIKY